MKTLIILILLTPFIFAYTLQVTTYPRNSKGEVIFLVYNKSGTIPDKNLNHYFKEKTTKIINNKATITFHLPKGKYAVSVVHDANNNHKVDMGFLLPKEGVGFSNFQSINLFNKPSFEKASFILNKNLSITVKMLYF